VAEITLQGVHETVLSSYAIKRNVISLL